MMEATLMIIITAVITIEDAGMVVIGEETVETEDGDIEVMAVVGEEETMIEEMIGIVEMIDQVEEEVEDRAVLLETPQTLTTTLITIMEKEKKIVISAELTEIM